MSRPPRPFPQEPTQDELSLKDGRIDYLPLEFHDFVSLQQELTEEKPPEGEGDFTGTLFELSALVSHILGVYQNFYASEAFLQRAQSPRSLVKHARRLAYEPDSGMSATGFVALTVDHDLDGTIRAGFALSSTPKGETKAQDFETTSERYVNSKWNEIFPKNTTQPAFLSSKHNHVMVQGTGLGLKPGEPTLLVGPKIWRKIDVVNIEENQELDQTKLILKESIAANEPSVPPFDPSSPDDGFRVLSSPSMNVRLFGWDADPALFPADKLENAQTYSPPTKAPSAVVYGYSIDPGTHDDENWYLSRKIEDSIIGDWLYPQHSSAHIVRVTSQSDQSVSFYRAGKYDHVIGVSTLRKDGLTKAEPDTEERLDERKISGSVTEILVANVSNTNQKRSDQNIRGQWHTKWQRRVPIVDRIPNKQKVSEGQPLLLDGNYDNLEPGMLVALSTLDGSVSQIVELIDVQTERISGSSPSNQNEFKEFEFNIKDLESGTIEFLREAHRRARGLGREIPPEILEALEKGQLFSNTEKYTTIVWKARTNAPSGHTWRLGNLKISGNIVPIVHGKAIEEILGNSDGITTFQRFGLKKDPLTHQPGKHGALPDLEIRIHNIRWNQVRDFSESTPEDRHYILERDEDNKIFIIFGDGTKGAIPPSGKKHIKATYRIGLGTDGNVEPGQISRIKKAHPLLKSAINTVKTSGGNPPADSEDIRSQSTRYIRTFNRAVSVSDYADLALLFSGVTKSSARYKNGIELIVATSDGSPLSDHSALREFLDSKRDLTVPLRFVPPEAKKVFLDVYIEVHKDFIFREVEESVRQALTNTDPESGSFGLFSFAARQLGQAAHLSEVYAHITAIEGVEYCQITHFSLYPNPKKPKDVLIAEEHQWLQMTPSELRFVPAQEVEDDNE